LKDVRPPVAALGPPLARLLRRPLADVTRSLRRGHGIFDLGDLTREEAESAAALLSTRDLPCRVLGRSEVPEPPEALAVRAAELRDDALVVLDGDEGLPERLPWGGLAILAAGRVAVEVAPDLSGLSEGRPVNVDPDCTQPGLAAAEWIVREAKSRPRQVVHLFLELLFDSPRIRVRMTDRDCRFHTLGIPLEPVSSENLRRVAEAVARRAPDTLVSGSALAFLEGKLPAPYRFERPAEFDSYIRWLLAIVSAAPR
jgi:hypothetical protein